MPAPSPGSTALLNIPQEDLSVTSYTREARIIGRHGNIQDRVAMRFVPLNRRGAFHSRGRIPGIAGRGTRKVNGAVGGSCEDVGAGVAREGYRVDGSYTQNAVSLSTCAVIRDDSSSPLCVRRV